MPDLFIYCHRNFELRSDLEGSSAQNSQRLWIKSTINILYFVFFMYDLYRVGLFAEYFIEIQICTLARIELHLILFYSWSPSKSFLLLLI
jgi:hypothetical protein